MRPMMNIRGMVERVDRYRPSLTDSLSFRQSGAAMGIYDREYYRGETGGPGWFNGVSPVCKSIVAINVAVFLLRPSDSRIDSSKSGSRHHRIASSAISGSGNC